MARALLLSGIVTQPRQMVASGIGGLAATLVDLTALVAGVHAGMPVALAALVAAAAGAVVGFLANKYLAFADRSPISARQCARFGAVACATAVLMAGATHVAVSVAGAPLLPAKLVSSALIFVAWTYPAQRRLVFVPRARELEPGMSLS